MSYATNSVVRGPKLDRSNGFVHNMSYVAAPAASTVAAGAPANKQRSWAEQAGPRFGYGASRGLMGGGGGYGGSQLQHPGNNRQHYSFVSAAGMASP